VSLRVIAVVDTFGIALSIDCRAAMICAANGLDGAHDFASGLSVIIVLPVESFINK
jgi:hypothetical protein